MKKTLLRWVYLRYRSFFYNIFVEEFLGDIPKDVEEPAMKFLSQGKDRMEKWALFQAHVLQTRLETDPDKIQLYKGMMLMLKLLLVHVDAPIRTPKKESEQKPKRDFVKEAADAVADMKEMFNPKKT